jgi:membrane-associated phospholipid phosphatase
MPHPVNANRVLATLSRVTDHSDGWLLLGLAGAVWHRGSRERWLSATGRIATVELASQGIKRAMPRDRPRLEGLPPLATTPSPRSFPSSHTAAAVAAVCAFDGLLPGWGLRAAAATTAFSRLYLGVHYPSDVLAGAVLGRLLVTLPRPATPNA